VKIKGIRRIFECSKDWFDKLVSGFTMNRACDSCTINSRLEQIRNATAGGNFEREVIVEFAGI
jgi:hypothetical protein